MGGDGVLSKEQHCEIYKNHLIVWEYLRTSSHASSQESTGLFQGESPVEADIQTIIANTQKYYEGLRYEDTESDRI